MTDDEEILLALNKGDTKHFCKDGSIRGAYQEFAEYAIMAMKIARLEGMIEGFNCDSDLGSQIKTGEIQQQIKKLLQNDNS